MLFIVLMGFAAWVFDLRLQRSRRKGKYRLARSAIQEQRG